MTKGSEDLSICYKEIKKAFNKLINLLKDLSTKAKASHKFKYSVTNLKISLCSSKMLAFRFFFLEILFISRV